MSITAASSRWNSIPGRAAAADHANADLWWDDMVTVLTFVAVPFTTSLAAYDLAGNHALVLGARQPGRLRIGRATVVARRPSTVFGVAGVRGFWFVARQLWPDTGAVGTFLFAVSYVTLITARMPRVLGADFFGLVATGCCGASVPTGVGATRRCVSPMPRRSGSGSIPCCS